MRPVVCERKLYGGLGNITGILSLGRIWRAPMHLMHLYHRHPAQISLTTNFKPGSHRERISFGRFDRLKLSGNRSGRSPPRALAGARRGSA